MPSEIHNDDLFPFVDGFRMPKTFDINLFRSALQYKAQSDDIFMSNISTIRNTSGCRVIVYTLLTNGKSFDTKI